MDRCDECGFAYGSVSRAGIPAALLAAAETVQSIVSSGSIDALRRRPEPGVWSALEYACHLRDVFLVQRDRLYLALVEDLPGFARMYRDERVTLARYNDQDPDTVTAEIGVAGRLAARAFANLDDAHWGRRFTYNWPASQERDVEWLASHTLHEAHHHLRDIEAVVSGDVPGARRQ